MILHIDPRSPTPPYEQLRAQIAAMVRNATLPAGARLPPIRGLAADLELAPNTVARAYRELEESGVVATRGRHGTFVLASGGRTTSSEERKARLSGAASDYAREALRLGVPAAEALDHVRSALRQLSGGAAEAPS